MSLYANFEFRVTQGMLRFYAFMMLLAVNLQLSICIVIIFDSTVTDAYLGSIVLAASELCETVESGAGLPMGAGQLLPIKDICDCSDGAGGVWNGTHVIGQGSAAGDDVRVCFDPFGARTFSVQMFWTGWGYLFQLADSNLGSRR